VWTSLRSSLSFRRARDLVVEPEGLTQLRAHREQVVSSLENFHQQVAMCAFDLQQVGKASLSAIE
jgi:hypothetical protein